MVYERISHKITAQSSSSVTPKLGGIFTQSTDDLIYFIQLFTPFYICCNCKLGFFHFGEKSSPRLERTLDVNGLGQGLIEINAHYIQCLHQTAASDIFKCLHGG